MRAVANMACAVVALLGTACARIGYDAVSLGRGGASAPESDASGSGSVGLGGNSTASEAGLGARSTPGGAGLGGSSAIGEAGLGGDSTSGGGGVAGGSTAGDAGRNGGSTAGDAGRNGGSTAGNAGRNGGSTAGNAGLDGGSSAAGDAGAEATLATEDAGQDGDTGSDGQAWPIIHSLVSMVSAGATHSCALRDGIVYCWGANDHGQLGLGVAGSDQLTPARALGDHYASVHVGDSSTCALCADGHVMCWGDNSAGQLGQGDFVEREAPTRVPLPGQAGSVSLFSTHACAVLVDGRLYCWGNNFEGQLGLNDAPDAPPVPTPTQVGINQNWQIVSAGEGHSCGVRKDATLFCWGRNTTGQLGIGSSNPIQIRTPTQVPGVADWTLVQAGSFITCGLRGGGTASCWGANAAGQAVPGASDPQVSPESAIPTVSAFSIVSTSIFHSCGLDAQLHLWCWGRNQEGQIGTGAGSQTEPVTQVGSGAWNSVSVGRFDTCGMDSSAHVFCTGANDRGQLGVGDVNRRFRMEQVF